jgi:histidinol-phosphate/aromatic aminotransferase/cobyric acid decarboxylase-like protein
MSRFYDIISNAARDLGAMNAVGATPAELERRSRLIRLDSNENPFGPSPRAVDAVRKMLNSANSYPDDDCCQLRYTLAEHHELPPGRVLHRGIDGDVKPTLPDLACAGVECGDQ